MLDRDTHHQLIAFLTPLLEDERQRKAIVNPALGNTPARSRIQWSGPARLFVTELVDLLADFSVEVATGEPALLAILEECRPYVGNEQWPKIDALCQRVRPRPSQPVWQGSPYPGLMAFTEPQAPIFFGRSREMRELLRKVALPEQRFVCVIGASGSGKSSLVAAGLIPALRKDAIPGSRNWLIIRCVPGKGNDPLLALAFALDRVLEGAGYRPEQVADQLAEDFPPLNDIVRAALREQADGAELLLFVDQLEELFTLVKEEAKVKAFVRLLGHAARHERLRLVATLRADFYAACLRHETLTELLRHGSFPLSPPGPAALYQMITQPAALAGLTLEEGLPERLLEETGTDPGRLALLAFTLHELYQARQGKQLTLVAYRDLGGVHGAIGRRADKVFKELGEIAQAALPVVFRGLVEVNETGVATRRRAPLARVTTTPGAKELIDAFSSAQARLLVTDRDIADRPVVEVAHEALFSAWSPLAGWIEERRDDLRLLHQVKAAADEWQRQGQDPAHLWRHERLSPVAEMLDRLDLKAHLEEPLKSFVRPEAERLLEELERPETRHYRRAEIGDRLDRIGDPRRGVGLRADGLPDLVWCQIPGGRVKLEDNAGIFDLAPFEIAKYPLTYRQYQAFLDSRDGYASRRWWKGLTHEKKPGEQYRLFGNCPADNVSWYDAMAFCRWLSARLGYEVRLPTEWEWQQAATGGDPKKVYPWGCEWKSGCANTDEGKLGRTTAVGMYPAGASKQGVMDLAGNVWEWCLNKYGNPKDTDLGGDDERVLRGGSWFRAQVSARAASRDAYHPHGRFDYYGFRVARCSPI